jgi:hypothetical protein
VTRPGPGPAPTAPAGDWAPGICLTAPGALRAACAARLVTARPPASARRYPPVSAGGGFDFIRNVLGEFGGAAAAADDVSSHVGAADIVSEEDEAASLGS